MKKETVIITCELDPKDKLTLISDIGGIVFKTTNGANVFVNKQNLIEVKELIENNLKLNDEN